MGDSTAMTIDFLRARLLSERSVSKSATQRADELAKRVEELEQELKLVSIQRKKAEKATADLLDILKNNGISDISEAFDSSSEHGSACESKMANSHVKEENSVDSKVRTNESEEVSDSGHDILLPGRSLSWKGRNGEKNDLATRRKNNFASTSNSSSPKQCPGRSCRKIRQSETRSQSIDSQNSFMKDDPLENEVSITSENCATVACGEQEETLGASKRQEETALKESHCSENRESSTSSNVDITRHEKDGDIEKALEDQAKLIDQYEAMENAQREWEEKFTETNCSRRDFCDRSSHTDITEEGDDIKEQASRPTETTTSQVPEVKTNEVDVISASRGDITCSTASSSPTQEFAFPVTNGNQNQEISGSDNTSRVFSSNSCFTGCKGVDSRSRSLNDQYALVPRDKNSDLSSVLKGLKMAKRSLKQQITALPSLEGGYTERYVGPSVHALKTSNQVDVPTGYAGLFRLPTGYYDEEAKIKSLSSDTELSLQNYNPNMDMGSRFFADDPLLLRHHVESGTRFPAHFPSLPPTNFSYADMIPRLPSNEGFPPVFSSMTSPAYRMLYDDRIRPNMYR